VDPKKNFRVPPRVRADHDDVGMEAPGLGDDDARGPAQANLADDVRRAAAAERQTNKPIQIALHAVFKPIVIVGGGGRVGEHRIDRKERRHRAAARTGQSGRIAERVPRERRKVDGTED
jgi:hypothetical protein